MNQGIFRRLKPTHARYLAGPASTAPSRSAAQISVRYPPLSSGPYEKPIWASDPIATQTHPSKTVIPFRAARIYPQDRPARNHSNGGPFSGIPSPSCVMLIAFCNTYITGNVRISLQPCNTKKNFRTSTPFTAREPLVIRCFYSTKSAFIANGIPISFALRYSSSRLMSYQNARLTPWFTTVNSAIFFGVCIPERSAFRGCNRSEA